MEMFEDLIFLVLTWLPAKAVCRCTALCKSFCTILEETHFRLKQAQNSLERDDPCFFIQPHALQKHVKGVELHALPGKQASSGVPNSVLRFLSKSTRILSSSGGLTLLCTTKEPWELFICNPFTGSWSPIPRPMLLQRKVKVEDLKVVLECSSDDYLVFLFERSIVWSSYVCQVYRAKEGAWITMETDFFAGVRSMEFNMPVLHSGALHFISDTFPYVATGSPYYKPYIMSYNLEDGMSMMLRLPKEATKGFLDTRFPCNMGIFKWNKASICVVRLRKSVFTAWFLKDYRSSSWQRILKVRVKEMGLKEKEENPNITGFAVMNGNLFVFATEKKVYSYGLHGERYMMLEEICQHKCGSRVGFISYSDSLRSCGIAAATLPGCQEI